ncbi:ABC transporter permease [Romeria aff. gracilis LEGE 07310]|uniref:ABC transporter permease n=1 Tax=Vasconcelosia minhoensis LEGE 07310 TaxID=915328 RepID=A0A8J7ADW2_9CYAN|nr:ABC transporter permease [Romeria gracilis]MBE9077714.1 ABC transporter permease [Romeria aff. gracilis LEGE 07310]
MATRSNALRIYVLSRLLLAPLMIWTITTVVFLLMRATPGDPVDALLGPRAPESAKAALRSQLGLDAPLWQQYFNYLGKLLNLDLGSSLTSQGQTVWQIIRAHFPATVELTLCGLLIAAVVGLTVGAIAASRPNTPLDAGGRLFGIITYAVPMYWFGMLLQLLFAVQLRWFPIGTRFPLGQSPPPGPTGLYLLDSLLHGSLAQFGTTLYYLALPSLTLGILISGVFERIVRVNLKQTLQADYVEAARARGIPEFRIVTVHALRNAMIPVITILGLTFASLLGGAVLTEVTFSWPGLANRLFEAISQRDYPVVQGLMVFFGGIVAIVSILIDILNAYVDPRIRY